MDEVLDCSHESGNDFDMFCIKVCKNGTIVGHLPREVSRPTKFILDRGAIVKAQLTGSHYRKSPLFQGGLEIPCIVTVTLPGTIRNHMVLDRYRELVTNLYCEPANEVVVGNFLEAVDQPTEPVLPPKRRKKNQQPTRTAADIRTMFKKIAEKNK